MTVRDIAPAHGHRPTVSAGFVRGLLTYAESRGACRDELLAHAGISARIIDDNDARVPLECYMALMRAAEARLNDPALALHFGESVGAMELSVVCLIGSACATMTESFAHMNRYARLTLDVEGTDGGDHFRLRHTGEGVWMIDARSHVDMYPQLTESSFVRMVSGTRRLSDRSFVRAVRLMRAAPRHAAEYHRVFGAPVTFGCARNEMLMDPAWFALRIAMSPPYAADILKAHADAMLAKLQDTRSCRGRVEEALRPLLATGDVSMPRVARALGMSRQTLYRALKAERVTYEEVLGALRLRMALQYLHGPRASVNEAARRVGFSEPAAFSRAFKRWTGSSPRVAVLAGARPA